MLLHVSKSGRDFILCLTDNMRRELYAKFLVIVRKDCIISYEFHNFKLLDVTFQYICKYIAGLYLVYLKRNTGKLICLDLDDFSLF